MIKYIYFESKFIGHRWKITNEKILYDEPNTDNSVYLVKYGYPTIEYYVDVEKRLKHIKHYIITEDCFQEVYDKLLLQDRNNKLETL